jgi:hypothetical protein
VKLQFASHKDMLHAFVHPQVTPKALLEIPKLYRQHFKQSELLQWRPLLVRQLGEYLLSQTLMEFPLHCHREQSVICIEWDGENCHLMR